MLSSASKRNRFGRMAALLAILAAPSLLGAGCGDTGTIETSCSDGVKNGTESDIDCGGTACKPCADGQTCSEGTSCTSGVCTNETCRPASCTDGVQNADEIKVDCGGHCTQPETCNEIDDDCNGLVDDGIASIMCGVGTCQITIPGCSPNPCSPDEPGLELCDGMLDEDCDGVVDNGCDCTDGTEQTCYTGAPETLDVGECKSGKQICKEGMLGICENEVTPQSEVCNGLDDDCNGLTDDNVASITCGEGACLVVQPGCVNGVPGTCTPGQPTTETCNGLDDDCNGSVDDGLSTLSCGMGACAATAPACVNGVPGTCTPGQPMAETCNGLDDDCNGSVDDGLSPLSCGMGACAATAPACVNGVPGTCTPGQPMTETCNGVDDDCNGAIDDACGICTPFAMRSCYSGGAGTAGVGICKSGTQTCNSTGSAWGPCVGEVLPSTESCKNNLDDDCDAQVNEGCAALSCQNFYIEDFNDGVATPLMGVYDVDWCNSYVATSANTPLCLAPGQTTRTNATGGTNAFVGMWVNKATASCSAVRLSYDWYQFASAGAVVEYKQTSDTFSSYSSCSSSSGWTTAVPSTSMSALQTCSSTTNINIPFGSSPAVYIKFKSTNAQNNAMWWDNVKLTLVGCDC